MPGIKTVAISGRGGVGVPWWWERALRVKH